MSGANVRSPLITAILSGSDGLGRDRAPDIRRVGQIDPLGWTSTRGRPKKSAIRKFPTRVDIIQRLPAAE